MHARIGLPCCPATTPNTMIETLTSESTIVSLGWDGSTLGTRTAAITEIETMPDIAANSHAIAFGDFQRGYLIVDRAGVRVLRDPYSAKPYVLFYTTKRVGGGVQNFEAIKLIKFAAS